MPKQKLHILSEILLELTLSIGKESEFEKIVMTSFPIWLKRLNCVSAGLFAKNKNKNEKDYLVPAFLKETDIFKQLKDALHKLAFPLQEQFEVIRLQDTIYYVYNLSEQHWFLFGRKKQLTEGQISELIPIVQFLAISLGNAEEKQKRIEAEKELQSEKLLLKTVIDYIPDAVYLKDLQLRKIIANKADIENTGFEKESEVIGKTDAEIYDRELAEDSTTIEQKIIHTGEAVIEREEIIRNVKGKKGWLLTSKFPYRNADNEITGIVGISKDISEKKLVTEQLERLSLVASQTSNGVIITDVEGKTVWVNEGFTRLSGYTIDEFVGQKPGTLLQGPDSDPVVIQEMKDAIQKREPFEAELINYHKDGSQYWINISCNPLMDKSGNIRGFMAIETDITEKKIIFEELSKAKRIAEVAQEAEKSFLANMSHEIRTPLNAIIGMTSLLLDTNPTFEQRDYLNTLEHSSKFLIRLISDILDIAKIESGKIEVKKKSFSLHNLLKTIQKTFELKASIKEVEIYLEIDKDVPEFLFSDEVLLQQILNNLMSNAEKFTHSGSITISVNSKLLDSNDVTIDFQVQDTGIGIPEKNLKGIFNKFEQVKTQATESKVGTGLGLSITKQIIELLGGKISVTSKEHVGTTFEFSIPFKLPKDQNRNITKSKEKQVEFKIQDNAGPILVVEDNLINQKYISRLLEKLKIPYELAENGNIGVDKSLHKKYALIFMDIQMPEMDGFEASEIIKNTNNPNKDTPIIALTASAFIDQKEKALKVGMLDYVSKPFTPSQLKEVLRKYYSSSIKS